MSKNVSLTLRLLKTENMKYRLSVPLKMHQTPFGETSDMKTDTYIVQII